MQPDPQRSDIGDGLPRALARARAWLIDDALPFWSDGGFDLAANAFHERVDLVGTPIISVPRRTMAQCRQIYAFAHAHQLGWSEIGAERAMRATATLIARHWQADGAPGWVFSVAPDGRVHDARRDTYAHAFVLLGLAFAYRIDQNPSTRRIADETLVVLDAQLAAHSHGGFDQGSHSDGARRQNPHMHLFEACLAWFETTGEARFLARAGEMFGLFTTRFFDPETGSLGEYFDDQWLPASGRPGTIREPGHHMEWVWLLHKYASLTGRDVERYAGALYQHAERLGRAANGSLHDEICQHGTVLTGSQRCWPHTEAVKAAAARHEASSPALAEASFKVVAMRDLDQLMDRFLGQPFRGGWIDHRHPDGSPKVDYVPSSTLYHAMLAIAEADRVFG